METTRVTMMEEESRTKLTQDHGPAVRAQQREQTVCRFSHPGQLSKDRFLHEEEASWRETSSRRPQQVQLQTEIYLWTALDEQHQTKIRKKQMFSRQVPHQSRSPTRSRCPDHSFAGLSSLRTFEL